MRTIVAIAIAGMFALPCLAQSARTYEYDALGRLKKVATSDGAVVTYTYDAADNRTNVTAIALSTTPLTPGMKIAVVPYNNGYLVIPID